MTHNWQPGDLYAVTKYDNLRIVGVVEKVLTQTIVGTQITANERGEFESLRAKSYWRFDDVVPLLPPQTVEEVYLKPEVDDVAR